MFQSKPLHLSLCSNPAHFTLQKSWRITQPRDNSSSSSGFNHPNWFRQDFPPSLLDPRSQLVARWTNVGLTHGHASQELSCQSELSVWEQRCVTTGWMWTQWSVVLSPQLIAECIPKHCSSRKKKNTRLSYWTDCKRKGYSSQNYKM